MGEYTQEVAVRPSSKHKNLPLILTVPVAVMFLFFGGCENDDSTRPTSDLFQIRLETDLDTLAPGDSTEVRATIVDAVTQDPVAGREVFFGEMLNKHSGTFAKAAATTNASGVASTIFHADVDEFGEVVLKVTANGQSAYKTVYLVTMPVNDLVLILTSPTGATAVAADGVSSLLIRLNANFGPQRVPVPGLDVTLVSGERFLDNDGDGTFTEGDELYPGSDWNDNGEWDALGTVASNVTTGPDGMVEFILRSGTETGTTYLRATADGSSFELPIDFHSTSLQISIETDVVELMADGISMATVIASVSDWSGTATEGVIVRFAAGEPFTDVGEDGEFSPGVDSFTDWNDNGEWDAIGHIDPYSATREGGRVSVFYTAGIDPGEVRIRATVTGGSAEGRVTLVPVPSAAQLEVEVNRTSVYADGESPVTGQVSVFGVSGTPLAGKRVTLVAGEPFDDVDRDGLFTDGTDVLLNDLDNNGQWSEIGTIEPMIVTGGEGTASFIYRAGYLIGDIMIKATVDGIARDLEIRLQSLPAVNEVVLTREYDEILVRGGGGVDNVLITAFCYDALGDTVPSGIPVEFSILAGPGGGEYLVEEEAGVYRTRTDSNGQARAVLVSGTLTGVVDVVATIGSAMRTIGIGIAAGQPYAVELHADDQILTFWAETQVCAYVRDMHGNPVRDETIVLFNTDEGMIEGTHGLGSSATRLGMACATFHSLGPSFDTDFLASITARVQGTTVVGMMDIELEETPPPPITELELSTDRERVSVRRLNEAEEIHVVARGFTFDGLAVGAGYPIDFWIETGPQGGENLDDEGWGPVSSNTNQDGIAQVTLNPGTLPGPVRIRAHSGTANIVSAEIQIVAGPPVDLVCNAVPDQIESEEECEIHAYLYDEYHNPVQNGVLVSFQVDEGMVVGMDGPGSSRTLDGAATATYYSLTPDPDGDGIATITCTAEGGELTCTTNVRIPVRPTGLATLHMTVDEPVMMVTGAGGVEAANLTIVAYTQDGQIVGNGYPVRFEVTSGPEGGEALDGVIGGPTTRSTDTQGRANVALTTGTNAGDLRVQARYGQIWSNEVRVRIEPGPADEIACWPGRSRLFEDDTTTVFVRVRDLHRNPVRDSSIVTFVVDEGWVNGTAYEGSAYSITVGGYATGLYHTSESVPDGDGWAEIDCVVQEGPICQTMVAIPSTAGDVASMRIYSTDHEIGVNGTGAIDQTEIVATPMNAQEGIIGPGLEVDFRIVSAPAGVLIEGESSAVTKVTRVDGTAHVTLTAGAVSGLVSIEATCRGRTSDFATVLVAAGPPAFISCSAPDSVACNAQLTSGEVRAYVTDLHHNPVRDGTPVWFTADAGLITGAMDGGGGAETAFGIAYAWYYSPLDSECDTWTQATLTFYAGDLVCTQVIYKQDDD